MTSQQYICSYCRTRKIYCDGARPQCGACVTAILACSYDPIKPRTNVLAKGRACIPCRQAKTRCDANRPECTPCQKSQRRGQCLYDRPPPRTTKVRLEKDTNLEDTSVAPVDDPDGYTASLDHEYWSSWREDEIWTVANPSLSNEGSAFDFSTLHISGVSQNDRNLVFRLIYLSYDLVHGNIYTSEKAQAIILGDVSGTVIPPFFVYFAELTGRHQYQLSRMEFSLWKSQGALGQLAFRFLSMIRLEDDPFTFSQAHWMVALAMMVIGNPNLAWKHYRRAITVIRRHDIRFAPKLTTRYPGVPSITTGFVPSEGDHERVAFLAKILYLEAFLYFYTFGLPGTKVWANRDQEDRLPGCADGIRQDLGELCHELECQFLLELPVAYPLLWETCPLIMRTKTFLWLKDVKKHLEESHTNVTCIGSPTRIKLIVRGSECLQHMLGLAKKYSDIGDRDRRMVLRSNALLTITGLLELYRSVMVEGVVTTAEELLESRQKCGELLVLLANTSRQTLEEDGQGIKNFIMHDHDQGLAPYDSQTIVYLVSTGGFAATLLPLPSQSIGTVDEGVVEWFLSSPVQKVIEINFNLAAKDFWGKFMDASKHATKSSANWLLRAALE